MGRWLLVLGLFGCGGLSAGDDGLLCGLEGTYLIEATSDTCEPITSVKDFQSKLVAFCEFPFHTADGMSGHMTCDHETVDRACHGEMTGNGCTYEVTARACGRDLPLSCSPADATPQPASPGEQEALSEPAAQKEIPLCDGSEPPAPGYCQTLVYGIGGYCNRWTPCGG